VRDGRNPSIRTTRWYVPDGTSDTTNLPSVPVFDWRLNVGDSTITIAFGTGSPDNALVTVPETATIAGSATAVDAYAASTSTRNRKGRRDLMNVLGPRR
jgi:hypothetical protein